MTSADSDPDDLDAARGFDSDELATCVRVLTLLGGGARASGGGGADDDAETGGTADDASANTGDANDGDALVMPAGGSSCLRAEPAQ